MTAQWSKISLSSSAAMKGVNDLQNTVIPVIDVVTSMLELAKTTLEIAAKFIVGLDDIPTTILKAAIALVRDSLESFGKAGCYVLPVSSRALRDINAADAIPQLFMPDPSMPESAPAVAFLPETGRDGGNYGFYRDVIASLYDVDDVLRPQFSDDSFVAGAVLVAGTDLYSTLIPFLLQLAKLMGIDKPGSVGTELVPSDFPRPTGLSVEFVPASVSPSALLKNRVTGKGAAIQPYAAKLRWGEDESVIVLENTPGGPTTYIVREVIISRSTSPLTASMTDEEILDKKIAVFEHNGWLNEFYDETIELNTQYWYAVSYHIITEQTDTFGTKVVTEYLADFPTFLPVFVPAEINTVPRSGVPPDWILLPSPLGLIPPLTKLVDQISVFLDKLEKRLDNSSKEFEKYVEAVQKDAESYIDFVNEIVTTIRRLVELMAVPQIYFGSHTFNGKGGNSFIASELGKAFSPSNDADRPPFDQGTEALAGLVILVGAEAPGALKPFIDLMEFLFGSSEGASAAMKTAMDSLGAVWNEAERQVKMLANLDENTGPVTTPEVIPNAIGADLEPSKEQYVSQEPAGRK